MITSTNRRRTIQSLLRASSRLSISIGLAAVLFYAEGNRTVAAAGAEIAGNWEIFVLARQVPALGIVAAAPLLALIVAIASLAPMLESRRGRAGWGLALAAIALALALELSTGRVARRLTVRVPFAIGLVAAALVFALVIAPRLRRLCLRQPVVSVLAGAASFAAFVVADQRVLPRLYPAFHHALAVCAAVALVGFVDGALDVLERLRFGSTVLGGLVVASAYLFVIALGRAPEGGAALAKYDNARRIADERSAVLARVVALASRRWPPPPLEVFADGTDDPLGPTTSERAVNAGKRDLLLVTIDAVRADHVGAYGYRRRPTTPNLDALAAEGVLFEHCYTGTPHTSYTIASLMTGKYMRSIVALEAAAQGVGITA